MTSECSPFLVVAEQMIDRNRALMEKGEEGSSSVISVPPSFFCYSFSCGDVLFSAGFSELTAPSRDKGLSPMPPLVFFPGFVSPFFLVLSFACTILVMFILD